MHDLLQSLDTLISFIRFVRLSYLGLSTLESVKSTNYVYVFMLTPIFYRLQVPAYPVNSEFVAEYALMLFSNVATEFITNREFV